MRRNLLLSAGSALMMLLALGSCSSKEPSDLTKTAFIPLPDSVTATGEWFTVGSKTGVYVIGSSEEVMKIGGYLSDILKTATGYDIKVSNGDAAPAKGSVVLNLAGNEAGNENYVLTVDRKRVEIAAASPAGLFRGVQTLRQILPASAAQAPAQPGAIALPAGVIKDSPEYAYRGVMLDVARHFFPAEDVKRLIDYISLYKINTLHLHLTDDQGWRIEIKSWPELAIHGGSTEVGGGEGGYFTQEQYSEIVRYAAERYITVIPEIDMPGHTNAALASYAGLNCDNKARDLYTGTNVGFSTLCVRSELTYKFVSDVLGELSALTPGEYIHIGGDESHSTKHDDYIYFVEKVQEIVKGYGKKVLGWDEIANTKLAEGSVAQYWAKAPNAVMAVEQGAKVLFSPAAKTYLDMKYDSTTTLGLHWAGYVEVSDAYNWDPATLVEGIGRESVLGVEAPLWTETVTNLDEMEYMIFPRLAGIAEIGWTSPQARNWEGYKVRLAEHGPRMKAMGIDFYPSAQVPWK